MTVLLITYDLNKDGQDYEKLLDVIRKEDYVYLCKSSYAVDIDNEQEFIKKVSKTYDKTTSIYLFPLLSSFYFEYGSSPETSKWLESHLNKTKEN